MFMNCHMSSKSLTSVFGIPSIVADKIAHTMFKVEQVGFHTVNKPKVYNIVGTDYAIEEHQSCPVALKVDDFETKLPWSEGE